MNRTLFFLAILFLLMTADPAAAAKIYTVDPEGGAATVTEQGGEEAPAVEEKPAACPEDEKEIGRLREIARRQQEALLGQQALIAQLQQELRRKENIIQGLDQLRRQGR